jgi:nitrite reductase/ring-hydroxylating ferredoxin subunit
MIRRKGVMIKKIGVGLVASTLMLIAVACANSAAVPSTTGSSSSSSPSTVPISIQATTPKPAGSIKATIIEAQVNGDTVSIPVSDVEQDWNTQFAVDSPTGKMNFMAYLLGDKIYIRADVCPPCRSIGYSLNANTLICNTCATTFKANTGDGIAGACVDYPKASVPYTISNGSLVMKQSDLVVAYQNTLKPGWP